MKIVIALLLLVSLPASASLVSEVRGALDAGDFTTAEAKVRQSWKVGGVTRSESRRPRQAPSRGSGSARTASARRFL